MAFYCTNLYTNSCTRGENWCMCFLRKHPEKRAFNQASITSLIFVLNNNVFNIILFLSSIRLETSPWSMSFQVKFFLRMKRKNFTTQFLFFQQFSLPMFISILLGDHLNLTDTLGTGWCLCTERLWRQENFYYLSRHCTILIAQSENWGWWFLIILCLRRGSQIDIQRISRLTSQSQCEWTLDLLR